MIFKESEERYEHLEKVRNEIVEVLEKNGISKKEYSLVLELAKVKYDYLVQDFKKVIF